ITIRYIHSFPTRRSSDLFLENFVKELGFGNVSKITPEFHDEVIGFTSQLAHVIAVSLINSDDIERNSKRYTGDSYRDLTRITNLDRKSTRLNSSHVSISY